MKKFPLTIFIEKHHARYYAAGHGRKKLFLSQKINLKFLILHGMKKFNTLLTSNNITVGCFYVWCFCKFCSACRLNIFHWPLDGTEEYVSTSRRLFIF